MEAQVRGVVVVLELVAGEIFMELAKIKGLGGRERIYNSWRRCAAILR
jgi:hypothetical protein